MEEGSGGKVVEERWWKKVLEDKWRKVDEEKGVGGERWRKVMEGK